MLNTLPEQLSDIDKKRTMKIKMRKIIFERMTTNKRIELSSLRSWANMPQNEHLVKEYKQYKKDLKQNKVQVKMVAHG